jgi:hypothetical protein
VILQRLLFGIALVFAYNPLMGSAMALPPPQIAQSRPRPPETPPDNRTQPGGGLSEVVAECTANSPPLTALIPVQNPVLTTADQPTVLFYIPDGRDRANWIGEFSIVTQDHKQRIDKIRVTLPAEPGIVSVSLPQTPENKLQRDRYYRWYFQLYCGDTPRPDVELHGWILTVPSTPERQTQIHQGSPVIWYDAIAHVFEQRQAQPDNPQLKQQWQGLLRQIDAEALADFPLVGAAVP